MLGDIKTNDDLISLIKKSVEAYTALSPEEKTKHDYAQRRSFVRGMCPSDTPLETWSKAVDDLLPPLEHASRSVENTKSAGADGWPTYRMKFAGQIVMEKYGMAPTTDRAAQEVAEEIYNAMLAAAPSPAGETREPIAAGEWRMVRISDLGRILGMLPPRPLKKDDQEFYYAPPEPVKLLHQIAEAFEKMLADKPQPTTQPNAEVDVKRVKGVLSGAMWNYWENNEFHPDSYADMLTEALASAGLLRSRDAVLEDEVVRVLEPFARLKNATDKLRDDDLLCRIVSDGEIFSLFAGQIRAARDLLTRIRALRSTTVEDLETSSDPTLNTSPQVSKL